MYFLNTLKVICLSAMMASSIAASVGNPEARDAVAQVGPSNIIKAHSIDLVDAAQAGSPLNRFDIPPPVDPRRPICAQCGASNFPCPPSCHHRI
ncbi:unnamed protein product [Tilletia controversa]|uniref:Long chronological lifespan protein 2 n=3 Tax=Tilletia TaxID=13289 RepID=A0A8X7N0U9_9BASI|nr:hypothetical protein CF336_g716 [Tilletia laevis]KAE8205063.1 hypothetical protein CF328_g715 [Tilletia controversa]KAE8265218.1 hypothetical protein A4X03_0g417 [Tilletia caries]KAE8208500.1 hypothetical protein CF335_g376 [Tilletia laevis]KAE8254746.1 hypothetical protein A4X06_0g753 [Tilletia controversa]